jgi:hypothetical protein
MKIVGWALTWPSDVRFGYSGRLLTRPSVGASYAYKAFKEALSTQ